MKIEYETKFSIGQKVYGLVNKRKGETKVIKERIVWIEVLVDDKNTIHYYHLSNNYGCLTDNELFLNENEAQKLADKINSGEIGVFDV